MADKCGPENKNYKQLQQQELTQNYEFPRTSQPSRLPKHEWVRVVSLTKTTMATVHVQDGSSSDNTEDSDQYGN